MTRRLLDPKAKKVLDVQLDTELQETFPASDPLKITRFAGPLYEANARTEMSMFPRHRSVRVRSTSKGSPQTMSTKSADHIKIKRAYEPPASEDGTRVLIDRLWPRGVKKADAAIDEWMKTIAPSTELRKWFGHAPERWPEFQRRYRSELQRQGAELGRLRGLAQDGRVTLVYAAHDAAHNDAVVLRKLLLSGD